MNIDSCHPSIGAFRKMQCNVKIDLAPDSNCRVFDTDLPENLFYSNIYLVSSKRPARKLDENVYKDQVVSILESVESVEEELGKLPKNSSKTDDFCGNSRFMMTHHASIIENQLLKIIKNDNSGLYCNRKSGSTCSTVFAENEKVSYVNTQFTGRFNEFNYKIEIV